MNESVVSREAHHALGWLHDVFHTPRRRHDHSGADIHLQTGHTVRKTGVRSSLNRTALHGAVQARLRPPTGPSSLRGCGEGRASRLLRASSSSWKMRAILWCLVMRVESRGEEFRASYVGLIVMRRKLESMAGIASIVKNSRGGDGKNRLFLTTADTQTTHMSM